MIEEVRYSIEQTYRHGLKLFMLEKERLGVHKSIRDKLRKTLERIHADRMSKHDEWAHP